MLLFYSNFGGGDSNGGDSGGGGGGVGGGKESPYMHMLWLTQGNQ